ncbi:MAG: dTDP-4-dehydrorhamnose reductase [Acidobacteria bacterium]|nr:dTDP-4-dehydrorhamnose reductase [Acidobacteriota bacterium]
MRAGTLQPILLTGVNGQVGSELLPLLQPLGEVIAPDRTQLDLTDSASIRTVLRDVKPQWIINAAAYTAVDKAESERDLAFAINAEAPRILGEEAKRLDATVLHFSTDYVFNGSGDAPWIEPAPTGPLSVYGESKLAGEQALASTGAAHFTFRTSWVYGSHGKNFLLTILRLAREREQLRIVADQHGAPTWSRDLAHLAVHTMKICNSSGTKQPPQGVYHACNAGETTWFGFAQEILRLAKITEPQSHFATLEPILTSEYPTPATRPVNSRLNCSRLSHGLGFTMPDWKDSLAQVMNEVFESHIR